MNPLIVIIWISASLVFFTAIIWLVLYLRIKRQKTSFPIIINYARREISSKGQFLYLELEMKNMSGKSIYAKEVHLTSAVLFLIFCN
jgi:hypothetical protein